MRRANLSKLLYGLLIFIFVMGLFPVFSLAANGAVTILEYPLPTPKSGPVGITNGPDGALWFNEYSANKIGRIDPTTHAITEYAIPTKKSGVTIGITSGPDGAVWFTETGNGNTANGGNKIGRIDLSTHIITEYPTTTKGSGPAYIATGPDGALWFTEQFPNQIGRIDPGTDDMTEYPTPSTCPWGITKGPDNALWFNECDSNIVQIDPTTYEMTEYPAEGICGGMAAGPDNAIWFIVNHNSQHPQIGRFDLSTHAVTQYPVPAANSNPDHISIGPDGGLWFTESNADKIARIDPTSYAIAEYAVPTPKSYPAMITSGPDGALWFTEAYGNKIGRVVLAAAPGAPANVTAAVTDAGKVKVTFGASTSNGTAIMGYTVTSNPAGGSDTNAGSTSSPHVVQNLKNGTAYTFTVTATNAKGLSSSSKPSNKVTTWTDPGKPAITSLKAPSAGGEVTVSFIDTQPKSNSGVSVTYSATGTPKGGGAGSTVAGPSPITVNNLANGTPYRFTVSATNAVGTTVSLPSAYITPEVSGSCGSANRENFLTVPTSDLCNTGSASAVTENGQKWNWTCTGTNGGSKVNCSANVAVQAIMSMTINGHTVIFTDKSTGPVTRRLWNFGDGSKTSTFKTASHTFGTGSHTVTLTVWGTGTGNESSASNTLNF